MAADDGPLELNDPVAMRALAHPLRLTLLRLLSEEGPATATQLSGRTGQSVASVAYHLTKLAKYGFIEDDDGAHGRARPWRARARGIRWSAGTGRSTDFVAASRLLRREFVQHALTTLERYQREEDGCSDAWREAAFVLSDLLMVSPDQLDEFNRELKSLIARFRDLPADERVCNARPVRVFSFGVPEVGDVGSAGGRPHAPRA